MGNAWLNLTRVGKAWLNPSRGGQSLVEIDEAVLALARGELVVFPTETVFGLGCTFDRPDAIEKIFAIKGRDRSKPLQVLVASSVQLESLTRLTPKLEALMNEFMPGPLTVVVPGVPGFGSTDGSVGIRMPSHPVCRELLMRAGPLAATSANRSGEPTSPDIEEIRSQFGAEVACYLIAGPIPEGIPSTVVSLVTDPPQILREGALAPELKELIRLRC